MKVSRSIRGKWRSLAILAAFATVMLATSITPALAATPITNCTELQNMSLTGDYYLANDINCSGFDYGDWNGFMPIGNSSSKFTGTFDGKGYKITHMYINRSSTNPVGLFGCTGSGSEIKNVSLEEVNVTGSNDVGGLVGSDSGNITNCYSSGSVNGSSNVGGLVGSDSGNITNCYSSGSVNGSNYCAGGLVGTKARGTITNCYSSGNVSGSSEVGGLVGSISGTITNCYSSGSVSGSSEVGGLVGKNFSATITNSYWDNETSGQSSSAGGTGKTTVEMKQQATFSGWDFTNIWAIEEGVTYPYLQWPSVAEPPNITSFAPTSPVNDTVCIWRTFNVTVNQTVNVSWYLNDTSLHTNESIREANYTLHAEYIGEHNVSAVAENVNGTDMETWVWNVATAPQTYNCTCGDICVNASGWWRHGGVFNANATMPIQAAVDNATAGETIYVYNGSYTENVNVNKQLTLEGEGAGVVTVTAALVSDHVFNVTANYVNISGFSVTAAGLNKAGIYLSGGQHCNISDNNASGNDRGIYLHSSCNYNTLANNTVNSNRRGIQLYSSSNYNTLTNNTANYNNHGIFLSDSSNNTLMNNTASNNIIGGIYLSLSSNNTIYNNYFNNTDNADDNGNNIWNITPTAGTNIIGGSWLGGNYWSDYAGADTTGDGLGDTLTPYNSSNKISNGGDYHPLVQATPLLTCDCGNICVNTSGWWRDGGVFNASGTRIQAAVTNATAGEMIYVYNGSYSENVNVDKRLTLRGEGVGVVNVTAASASDHVFEVTVGYVNISGFTLENATANGKAGIYLGDGVNSCNITNNTVKLNYNGIYLKNASDNNITCNWVHGNTRAGFNLTGGSIGNNISRNNIVANGVPNSGGWEWQFYNDQVDAVKAKNNYWGAAMNKTTINASIYDWQDDPANCGNVTYNPFEEDPNICAPIPELSTVILLGIGLLLLAGYLRIRRKG